MLSIVLMLNRLSGLGRGDLKESYHFKTFTSFPEVELPSELDTQRSSLKHFSKECERVGSVLLEGFAMGLGVSENRCRPYWMQDKVEL